MGGAILYLKMFVDRSLQVVIAGYMGLLGYAIYIEHIMGGDLRTTPAIIELEGTVNSPVGTVSVNFAAGSLTVAEDRVAKRLSAVRNGKPQQRSTYANTKCDTNGHGARLCHKDEADYPGGFADAERKRLVTSISRPSMHRRLWFSNRVPLYLFSYAAVGTLDSQSHSRKSLRDRS